MDVFGFKKWQGYTKIVVAMNYVDYRWHIQQFRFLQMPNQSNIHEVDNYNPDIIFTDVLKHLI